MNWERKLDAGDEFRLVNPLFLEAIGFLRRFKDPSLQERYAGRENGLLFRSIAIPIILNALDARQSGQIVVVSSAQCGEKFFPDKKADWGYVVNAVMALRSIDAIKSIFHSDDAIGFKASTRLTQNSDFLEPASDPVIFPPVTVKVEPSGDLDHSRLFDVHTWSAHPESNHFVDSIFDAHFSGGNREIKKKHLKVILLDLYLAWVQDPELKIAFSRDVTAYQPKSRYNALKISKTSITVVDKLIECGLVNFAKGFLDRERRIGRMSRIWPTEPLIKYFEAARFSQFDVHEHENRECIILRDGDEELEYKDTDATREMRKKLSEYNELLRYTFVDIPTLEGPSIVLDNDEDDRRTRLQVTQRDKFVRRIFNRASWEKGGRFWGGWWQRCPKEWREQIWIDDQPTSEIDYSGLHIVMLYAIAGIDYWDQVNKDPYQIQVEMLNLPPDRIRSICKSLLLVALNAKDEKATFNAFRSEASKGSVEKRLKNNELKGILDKLRERHHPIADKFASDAGIDLMRKDSEITALIMEEFTNHEVPILTIHDSFIVPLGKEWHLEKTMLEAFNKVMGPASAKVKEVTHNPQSMEPQSLDDIEQGFDYGAWEKAMQARFRPNKTKRYQKLFLEFDRWRKMQDAAATSSSS